jgi:hypothetical protein
MLKSENKTKQKKCKSAPNPPNASWQDYSCSNNEPDFIVSLDLSPSQTIMAMVLQDEYTQLLCFNIKHL